MRPRKEPPMTAKKGTGLLMVWADVPADQEGELNRRTNHEKVRGVIRGRRYRAVDGTPTYLTFYEFEHPKVSESPEWNAQRNAVPASETMRKHMRHAQGSPGVYVKTYELKR